MKPCRFTPGEAASPPAKLWWTAAELADARLPGLPTVKRKINERAAAERWAFAADPAGRPLARPRAGRGGGLEYHRDALPAAARAALAAPSAAADRPLNDNFAPASWASFDRATAAVKAEAARRLAAVQLVDAFVVAGLTRSAAVTAAAARAQVGSSTLWAWLELVAGAALADRLPHLAPRRQGGGKVADIDPEAWQLLLSDYLRPEQPTFTSCYWRLVKDWARPRGLAVPAEKTLRRKLEREVDPRLVLAKREGAEALRRSLPAQQRSVAQLHALEAVNIDGHKFDVFVRWPDGRIGRPMMVTIQDIFSRKIVAHRIDESENALATRLVFADLFRDYGIPRIALMDNSRAFASKIMTGGAGSRYRFKIRDEEPTGVLTALGIEVKFATPYRGQSKPIERAFRDLCDTIAKHPALAGAYTGNKPDAKPENYGSKAIPIDEFRAVVAAGLARHNAQPGRRTETANGRSFDQVFAASYAIAPIGRATPEQLRLALLTAEERMCDRLTGVVTLEGNRYWAEELSRYAGQKLTVRFDPDDLHGEVHVYDRAGAFICTAPAIAATGFFDKASAGRRRAQEAEQRKLVRRLAETHELLSATALAAMLPDHEDEAPIAPPTVIRPVRHRGQSAAALQALPEAAGAPSTQVIDRFARAAARLRVVE
ncbi:transposase domain-containing protein [Sphingomonas sp.]|uniref:transposase domain-containing protein n=1 Tax=Sphingomonas sp. TaxID=28214 RepID=UPI003CC5BF33